MKSILNSLIDASKDRIKNPFIGSFIFAWMVTNWKIVLTIFFSGAKIEDKLKIIEGFKIDFWSISGFSDLFFIPFLFSVFYMIVLPHIMVWVEKKLLNEPIKKRKVNNIALQLHEVNEKLALAKKQNELEYEKNKNLDIEEVTKKANKLKDKVNELVLSLKGFREQNNNFKVGNETLKGEKTELKHKIIKFGDRLFGNLKFNPISNVEEERSVDVREYFHLYIERSPNSSLINDDLSLITNLGIPLESAKELLKELQEKKLVSSVLESEGGHEFYEFTEDGILYRDWVLEKRLPKLHIPKTGYDK